VRLGVFGDGAQLLIDFIEQRGDKLWSRRTAPCCLSAVGFRPALPTPDK
jgi:hypothetical protein